MEKAMPAPPKVVAIAAAPPVKGGPTFTDRAADKSSNFREDGHFYPLSVQAFQQQWIVQINSECPVLTPAMPT